MKCQKCKSTKNLSKNSVDKNGTIQYLCRKCNTERARKYRATPNGAEKVRKAIYKSTDKHRSKHNARVLVYDAIKRGELCRPTICESCFKKREIFAHHPDYSKPLEVMWLCRNCHIQEHKKLL